MIRKSSFLCLLICVLLCLMLSVHSAEEENVYRCHGNSSMKIALTFDDGPHPRYTPEILDILKKYDVKATFFLIGENIALYPDLVKRILAEGHEIGNHTFTHRGIGEYTEHQLGREMEHCEKVIYEVVEYQPKLFRPPGGRLDQKVRRLAEAFEGCRKGCTDGCRLELRRHRLVRSAVLIGIKRTEDSVKFPNKRGHRLLR